MVNAVLVFLTSELTNVAPSSSKTWVVGSNGNSRAGVAPAGSVWGFESFKECKRNNDYCIKVKCRHGINWLNCSKQKRLSCKVLTRCIICVTDNSMAVRLHIVLNIIRNK